MFSLEHMLREPEIETRWLLRVWYPETKVRDSPEFFEISPEFFSELIEKVVGSALKIGKRYWLFESKTYPTPLNAMGLSIFEKIPLDVVVKGSKRLREYTVFKLAPESLPE